MMMFNGVSSQEKVDFAKNLAVMLKSGITLNEALASLAEQTKSNAFRRILGEIRYEIEAGTSLSDAVLKHEKAFGSVFLSLVKAGEASGTLDENLTFVADWLERNHDLRREISAATLYPKIVFSATLLLAGGLAVFILPRLVPLFQSLQVELPFITRMLMAFAVFVRDFWFIALLLTVGVIVLFVFLNRVRRVKRIFHALYLRLPFFGSLLRDYQLALAAQLFSTLFRSGLPVYESLRITSEAATNIGYRESIEEIRERVSQGTPISQAMRSFPKLYPLNVVNIIATGEKSGTLDNSFGYLAEFYSKEVRSKTKKLPTVIEPILLIFIGVTVGLVAISIIMPIYQLTRGLQG